MTEIITDPSWIDLITPPHGTVTGQFVAVSYDSADPDQSPDVQPFTGRAILTPTTPMGRVDGALAHIRPVPVRIFGGQIVDDEDVPGVRILATDAEIGVEDWAWTARIELDDGPKLKPITFKLPTDETVSLSSGVVPIEAVPYQIVQGEPGESAYEIARRHGYTGTEAEWLASTKGERGIRGERGPEGPYGGTEVTDPQVASWIEDPTTTTRKALAHADLLGDRGEQLVTALDQRRDAVVVVLGDSTGTPAHGEWPRRLGLALAEKYARTAISYQLYSSATSAYGTPEALASGEAAGTTVFADSFTRTAPELVGSAPDTGGVWTGTAGQYRPDGTAALYVGSGNALAIYGTRVSTGRSVTTADLEITYDGDAHIDSRVSLVAERVSSTVFLWATFTPGRDLVEFKVSKGGATTTVYTASNADAGISVSPTPQPLTMSIEHVGNTVTFTCGNASYAHTLSQADSDLFAQGTHLGIWGVNLPHRVMNIEAALTTPIPAQNTVTVYNGSVGSTLAWYPASRVLDMVPVRPDVVLFNYGHNHQTQTPTEFEAVLDATVAAIRAVYPGVPFIVGGQNPQYPPTANPAAHQEREAHKREYARLRGFGYAPVLEAFMAEQHPRTLVKGDGVHPTNEGAEVWTAAVDRHLGALSLAP